MRVLGLNDGWVEARAFDAVLKRVVKLLRRAHQPFARVQKAWDAVAPDLTTCRVVGFADGTLWVAVPSAPMRAELQSFRKHELIAALQARHDGLDVADITFRLVARTED